MKTVRRTGSIHALVRRLLTSLDDPAALRRNPLVSFLIAREPEKSTELTALVRSCVLRTIDDIVARSSPRSRRIAERRRYILVHYDIAGEERSAVADKLGITERQLFRERRIACEQLAAALSSLSPAARVGDQILTVREDTIPIGTALVLAAAGRHAAALAFLHQIAARSMAEDQKITAFFAAAQLHYDLADYVAADRLIDRCERLIRRVDGRTQRRADLTALLGFAHGRQLWRNGRVGEALRTLEPSIMHFSFSRGDRPMIQHRGQAYLIARELINIGDRACEIGDIARCNSMFFAARRIMDALHDVPPYLHAEWLIYLASSQMVNCEPFGDIESELRQATTLAEHHGYPPLAAHAAALWSCSAHRQGDCIAQEELKRASLRYAEMIETSHIRGQIATVLALIEHDPVTVVALAESALESFTQDASDRAYAWLAAGRAHLKSGDVSRARGHAERILAMPRLERTHASAYSGGLMLIAEVEFRAGKSAAARRQIEQALDLIQDHAPREMLVFASKIWTKVTGKSLSRRVRGGEPSQFFR